jgi:hypothetical protein
MFKIFINDGKTTPPKDDIFYIVAKSGIYLKKKLGIVDSITPVQQISVLNDISSAARLHLKSKIMLWDLSRIINFFKKVYENEKAEAMVVILYNENFGTYLFDAPDQEVSCGGISYSQEKMVVPANYIRLGTIHSHGSMSAFHSGTDIRDEFNWDGLHITIGDILKESVFDMSGEVVVNGARFTIGDLGDYIEGITKVIQPQQEIQQGIQTFIYNSKTEYNIPLLGNDFNQEWIEKVKKKVFISNINQQFVFPSDSSRTFPCWPSYFSNRSFDDIDDDNPCLTCLYRDYKIRLSDISEEDEDDNILAFNYERGE